MQPVKRRFPRATLRGSVQVNVPGKRVTGELLTLSKGGCFVVGVPKLKVGAEYRMFLLLKGMANPIQVAAKVLYHLPAMDGHEAGSGFAFTKIATEDETRVEDAVKKSGELYQRLLFALTSAEGNDDEIAELCREAGLPEGLSIAQLRWRVVQSVSQYRS